MAGGKITKKKVVVVGGGIGGALLVTILQSEFDVVLIDSKDYFEMPWAELRSIVEPDFANRSLIKHSDYLKKGTIITSSAVNVTENSVTTADGQSIDYDYLVIATGHAYTTPKSRDERLLHFKQENKKVQSASSVLIVGGGPTGVELAGELAVDHPEKKVTIVHKGSRLLEFIGPKSSTKASKWFAKKNVQVLLEQAVELNSTSESESVYTTTSGQKITADCRFVCTGKPTGSTWLENSILRASLDNKGKLKVDESLRVKGQSNIFAIGDITDVPELKLGYLAQGHAALVAKNLKLLSKGAKESKLGKYKPGPNMAIVSLGRKEAIAQFPFGTMVGSCPGKLKSKDLNVGRTRKMLGLEP